MRKTIIIVLLAVTLVAGCGQDGDQQASPVASVTTAPAALDCQDLPGHVRREVAGQLRPGVIATGWKGATVPELVDLVGPEYGKAPALVAARVAGKANGVAVWVVSDLTSAEWEVKSGWYMAPVNDAALRATDMGSAFGKLHEAAELGEQVAGCVP